MRRLRPEKEQGQRLFGRLSAKSAPDNRSRSVMIQAGVVGVFLVVLVRMVMLQVVHGGEYLVTSEENRIFARELEAPRGLIVAGNGEPVAVNEPVYLKVVDDDGFLIADPETVSREEAEALGEDRTIHAVSRKYPDGELWSSLVGYVGEAGEKEVESGAYRLGQMVGRTGIEAQYDTRLSGSTGSELVEVDSAGKVLRRVGDIAAEPGAETRLFADAGLQSVLHEAFEGRPGAAVATDPYTGEVLALVSSPTYDANLFSERARFGEEGRTEKLQALFEDEDKPLLNRVIGGAYPPGSVFKVVSAVAGLYSEEIDKDTEIEDKGQIQVDEYTYRNWFFTKYGRTDGLVNVVTALKRSNDIYFYRIGEAAGAEAISDWASAFGLGKPTGVDLPGEVGGLVPTPLWKEREKGERWFLGNTYHYAIGQGDLLTTPLGLNQMFGVVANGGRVCTPRVVDTIGGESVAAVSCSEVSVDPEVLETVKEGLVAACEPKGTAFPFFSFNLGAYGSEYATEGRDRVACKTGTAQFFDPDDRTHAWFSVFAPAVDPEILVTVLVEAGGEGSEEAAPIAKRALEYWFGERK